MRILTFDADPTAGRELSSGARTFTIAAAGIGIVAFAVAALFGDWSQFLRAYLVNFAWALSLSLGAMFFVLLQHLTGASWSVVVRRLAEATAVNVVLLAILYVPIVAGMNGIYEWTHGVGQRGGWYSPTFYVIRAGIYFGVWILIARSFLHTSRSQDESGDPALTLRMQRRAPLAMVLYGLTVTFAAFDLLMSLDPNWYSTIFGVYYYAGAVEGFFAFLILAVFVLQREGKLTEDVTVEHYHDLGKQLFGWNVFWAYIAFSQYMLIWYGNIPEEVEWFLTRTAGGWAAISWVLVIGHFIIPFCLLLPRRVKRIPMLMAGMAAYMLVMHWVDCYWLVAPQLDPQAGHVGFSVLDVACFVGFASLFVAGVTYALGGGSLLPKRDPRLAKSLAFENT